MAVKNKSCEFKTRSIIYKYILIYRYKIFTSSKDFSSDAIIISYVPELNWVTALHRETAGNSEFNTQVAIPNCSKNNFNL